HWSQRFRRMRVYNPRATFEQAELISKLFEESNKSKKQSGKQNQATESEEKEQTILFTDLPDDILLKIFNYISIPDHYGIQALQSNYLFGGRRIIAIKVICTGHGAYFGVSSFTIEAVSVAICLQEVPRCDQRISPTLAQAINWATTTGNRFLIAAKPLSLRTSINPYHGRTFTGAG
ncbi:hypothetical protein GCK32_021944, partial [Trichostrongylus colubriformis]